MPHIHDITDMINVIRIYNFYNMISWNINLSDIYFKYFSLSLIVCVAVVFQSLSRVWLFVTLWTAAHQASRSITISQSLLKPMSIQLVMPSNHLIFCRPLLLLPSIFPSIRVYSKFQLFTSGGQSTGASASTYFHFEPSWSWKKAYLILFSR